MTLRATVYLDPQVDSAIIAELERMSFRRRAGRLVQLLRIGAETSLRQRDGTLRGGLVRCRVAPLASRSRMRIGIRLSGPADAAVVQLLGEAVNRRSERLRQLAQCGLEREAFWLRNPPVEGSVPSRAMEATIAGPTHASPNPTGQPMPAGRIATRTEATRRANAEPSSNPWVMMAGFGTLPRRPAPGAGG